MPERNLGPRHGSDSPMQLLKGFGRIVKSGFPSDYPTLRAKAAVSRHLVLALELMMLSLDRRAPLHARDSPVLQLSTALMVALDTLL